MMRQSLARFGCRVLSAANGEEALQVCNLGTALAILALVMPRMGGAAAAAQPRDRLPNLPILFTSGYSEGQDSAISGFPNCSYLQTPNSPATLGRAVRKILDREPPA